MGTSGVKRARELSKEIAQHRNLLLSNLLLFSEIPAPTYGEKRRANFFAERLSQQHLHNCSTDDIGNAFGIMLGSGETAQGAGAGIGSDGENGSKRARNILIAAHLDTNFSEEVDHTVNIDSESVSGVGVGDNSLGVAVVATLPSLLENLGIRLRANIILMGTAHSLGGGNIAGIRGFLENSDIPIDNAIFVEGLRLGRLSVESIGMLRGEVNYEMEEGVFDWRRDNVPNAIVHLNNIVNRILELPLPSRPQTTVVLNALRCGRSFNWIPATGKLRFEIRSEEDTLVDRVATQIEEICQEVGSRGSANISLRVIARRSPGGLPFSHPLVTTGKRILTELGCEANFVPSTSELSACIDRGIPAITIGISESTNSNLPNEQLALQPIPTGVSQLLALLLAIDSGECDSDV